MTAEPPVRRRTELPDDHRARQHRDEVRRLRDLLRSTIVHGGYQDTKIPTESELMARYGVARGVVREALALLRSEGLIDRLQGYGTYVLHRPRFEDLSDSHDRDHPGGSGFWELVSRVTVLARRRVPTPDAVAALMPDAGSEVLQLDYLTHDGDDITGAATNYFRFPEGASVERTPFGTDFYDLLRRSGVAIGACEFDIGAAAADVNLAATIRVPPGTPLLALEQRILGSDTQVFDVAFIWLRADRVVLSSVTGPTPPASLIS
ncbi:MAG TPA: GntR family transcriptional regulator [Microlunatus sp.]